MSKNNGMCANCGQPAVTGSTLCVDCLPVERVIFRDLNDRKINDQDSLIRALKESNEEREKLIDSLIKEGLKKDYKIIKLEDRIKFMEKWARWNKGK